MDFDKALKEITNFLNISENMLLSQPIDLLDKMVNAVRDDDMFKVHSLGYSINSSS